MGEDGYIWNRKRATELYELRLPPVSGWVLFNLSSVLVTLLVEGGPNGDGVVLNGRGTPHAVFT